MLAYCVMSYVMLATRRQGAGRQRLPLHGGAGRELRPGARRDSEQGRGRLLRVIRSALLAHRSLGRSFSWLGAGGSARGGQCSQTPSQQYSRFIAGVHLRGRRALALRHPRQLPPRALRRLPPPPTRHLEAGLWEG